MPSATRAGIRQIADASDFGGNLAEPEFYGYALVWDGTEFTLGDFDAAAAAAAAVGAHVGASDPHTQYLRVDGARASTGVETAENAIVMGADDDDLRARLYFSNPGALVPAPWLMQTHSAGTGFHDNVLATWYNGYKNPNGSVTRVENNEHVVRHGMESRWVLTGDPTASRGLFEWNIQIATGLTGAVNLNRAPYYFIYDFDNDRTQVQWGDPASSGANTATIHHGALIVDGAGVQGYGLRVSGLPAWLDGGILLNANAKLDFAQGQLWTGASVTMMRFTADARPDHLGSVYCIDFGGNTIGGGNDRVQNFNMFRLNAATAVKGTSDLIISAAGMHISLPTIGLFNAALSIGNQTDGNWCIRSSSTQPSRIDGQWRVASLGVANSAAATTLGAVTKKIQVFDATGASLGYVPVYDAIT